MSAAGGCLQDGWVSVGTAGEVWVSAGGGGVYISMNMDRDWSGGGVGYAYPLPHDSH